MSADESRQRPARRLRGAYAKSTKTREGILDAALEVFAESGYRSGSLREIAAGAGLSEAGVLHHFPNKAALLEAVLDRRDELAVSQVYLHPEDGAETLRELIELARHNTRIPGVVELFCVLSAESTSPDHPAHAYFIRRYERSRNLLVGAFELLAAEGRLRAGVSPHEAAVSTLALMDGLQIQWLLDRDIVDMPTALADHLRSLVADFAPHAVVGTSSP
jgi:AcrR family transcriptional regulator